MGLVSLLFGGRREPREHIAEPPLNAHWRLVRPRPGQPPIRARLAEADTTVSTAHGQLTARGGQDYIVTYEFDDHAVVRRDIFERTYKPIGSGLYQKRTDVVLRYFTLDRPVIVETIEGDQKADAGDWIMQGVTGELWPVPRAKAAEKYEPA